MSSPNSNEHDIDYFSLDPKDEAGADFVALLGEQLQQAFLKRKKEAKLTYQQIAEKMLVDRSRVHRCFSGSANLTAETIGELGWALGGRAEVVIVFDDDAEAFGSNDVALSKARQEFRQSDGQYGIATANETLNTPAHWAIRPL